MSDYSKLKELAEAASEGAWVQDAFDVVSDGIEDRRVARCSWLTDAQYIAAANPAAVLALIAENERLKNRLEVDPRHDYDGISTRDATVKVLDEQVDQLKAENERLHESDQEATELCDTLSVLLGEIAVAVRGPEEPKSRHGFHDLPSRVKTVVGERDQLKTMIDDPDYPPKYARRLIAELKAEVEALRKDAERYRWLRQHDFDIGSYHPGHEHNASDWFEHIDGELIDRGISDESEFAADSTTKGDHP